MPERSKLVRIRIANIGPIGPEGLTVELDNIVCLVGANNAGKSTVLRAYELALGAETFSPERDLCTRAEEPYTASVELWVHIPKDTPNIAEKWKVEEGGLLLVRSRWIWSKESGWKTNRQTWDPDLAAYAEDDKASGLDTVFTSRLPQPFRVGTLEDPAKEHDKLLQLVLQPVADRLKASLADEESPLRKALTEFTAHAKAPVEQEENRLTELKGELNRSHNAIFPDLEIDFDIGLGELDIDPIKLLLRKSHIKFIEWTQKVDWDKQGTGSQRALFWTMLQVRSRLNALSDVRQQINKDVTAREKSIAKLQREAEAAKGEGTKKRKQEEIEKLRQEVAELQAKAPEQIIADRTADLALPGYMLLIDEPEVGLHPNAIRAACEYLYAMADDPSWQVMLSTHSPQFIDPTRDHTTIVRLNRSDKKPTPHTFRSEEIGFTSDEKENLKMLNRFDSGLAEMFFGQYPILIEGDTEFAAFQYVMQAEPDSYPIHSRPALIRARGKFTLMLLVRMLKHFKIPFAVLHDSDSPRRKDGRVNGAWTANRLLYQEIKAARDSGVFAVHRISVPNFEHAHTAPETDAGDVVDVPKADKPWNMIATVKDDPGVFASVRAILDELNDCTVRQEPFDGGYDESLAEAMRSWVNRNAINDPRYVI